MTVEPDGYVCFDLRKGPSKKVHTYVFTNLTDGELTFYSKFGEDNGFYTEPFNEMVGQSRRIRLQPFLDTTAYWQRVTITVGIGKHGLLLKFPSLSVHGNYEGSPVLFSKQRLMKIFLSPPPELNAPIE